MTLTICEIMGLPFRLVTFFHLFWIERKSNGLGHKTESGLEKTKQNYKKSTISEFDNTI